MEKSNGKNRQSVHVCYDLIEFISLKIDETGNGMTLRSCHFQKTEFFLTKAVVIMAFFILIFSVQILPCGYRNVLRRSVPRKRSLLS